jgi:bifunctional NMN adenylyltransferase/nudix hydrolase
MTYNTLVFIGRFQPFHKGHQAVVNRALYLASEVIIVVGSSLASRNSRNPLTFTERAEQIKCVYPHKNIKVVPVSDYPYNDNKWVGAVQEVVNDNLSNPNNTIGLIGHKKDSSSYYLNIFPMWGNVPVENQDGINSTDIRNEVFLEKNEMYARENMPLEAYWAFDRQLNSESKWSTRLTEEAEMVRKYKESWSAAPYAPTFVTVDAVVVQSGHVLLVKRGAMPGKGLWALPGGFINTNEKLVDAALRELREETKLKVPLPILKGSIVNKETFDDPYRSQRGRTITTAYLIDLGYANILPKVKGSDDAVQADWVAFSDIDSERMYEDHYSILDYFLNIG